MFIMVLPIEIQDKIIDLFCNTKTKITAIYNIINRDFSISYEEFYSFLYNYRTETGECLQRGKVFPSEKYKDYIFELRSKGTPFYRISSILLKQDVKISSTRVKQIYEMACAEKNIEASEDDRSGTYVRVFDKDVNSLKTQGISQYDIKKYFSKYGIDIENPYREYHNEDYNIYKVKGNSFANYVYDLRKQRKSYRDIVKELETSKIHISMETVRKICKKKSIELNEVEPTPLTDYQKRIKLIITDELKESAYELRNEGLTYKEILKIVRKKDPSASYEKVKRAIKVAYAEKNEKEAKRTLSYEFSADKNNKTIYELRKQGLTYGKITEELNKQGYNLEKWVVAYRCQRMFEEKGASCNILNEKWKKARLAKSEIYYLRKQGYSDSLITEKLRTRGVEISRKTVYKKMSDAFREKGEPIPDAVINKKTRGKNGLVDSKTDLLSTVLRVADKKKASKEQLEVFIKEVSKMYNTDIGMDVENIDKER
ncbi:MAG: hypothetical protein K6B70_02555 [Clostridia bacterium]|nr:hypothetical protein [Clostridia bacterium]